MDTEQFKGWWQTQAHPQKIKQQILVKRLVTKSGTTSKDKTANLNAEKGTAARTTIDLWDKNLCSKIQCLPVHIKIDEKNRVFFCWFRPKYSKYGSGSAQQLNKFAKQTVWHTDHSPLILQQRVEQCDLCLALMIGSHATHCPSWQFPSNSNLELKHYKGPFSLPEWRLNPRRLSARLLGLLLASATLARNVTFPKRASRLLNGLSWDYNNPREAVTFPPNPRPADWNLGGMSAKPEGVPIKNQQWICLVTTFFYAS